MRGSRKAVRKVLRSDETEFHHERGEPPLSRPAGGKTRSVSGWGQRGDAIRERLTLIRIFEARHRHGSEGGRDAAQRYARVWQPDGAAT